jgi:hypothetical protein
MKRPLRDLLLATATLAVAAVALAPPPSEADAAMRSVKIAPGLCKTVGGGKFVDIRRFPGERIDRRLLRDIRWMVRRYAIFVTDGYSTSPVHAWNGEHPIGLALDIVPDRPRGGTWKRITRLATFAEPRQNQPRPPWRWVGYDGDSGHGRGHHLHLSYMHSDTQPTKPARTVYTYRCPKRPSKPPPPPPEESAPSEPSGAVKPGQPGEPSGAVRSPRYVQTLPQVVFGDLAPVVPETGGVGLARIP